jgi:cytochrome c biogenesis protein CcmG, thiol:disulfide interchange protein DsbE
MLPRHALVSLVLVLVGACRQGVPPPSGPAPQFELPDVAGGSLSLDSLKGKVVIVDFWATWCGPCIQEMPEYAEFYKKNRTRGVEVVGIVLDSGEPRDIADFLRDYRTPYRQLIGDPKVQADYGPLEGFPTTFVIDAQGKIRHKLLGARSDKFEQLQELADALLARQS